MIIISAAGGSGSSFIIRSLYNFNYQTHNFNPTKAAQKLKRLIAPVPKLINKESSPLRHKSNVDNYRTHRFNRHINSEIFYLIYTPIKTILRFSRVYDSKLKILSRPDSFYSNGLFDPNSDNYEKELSRLKMFIFKTINYRSAGLKIKYSNIKTNSIQTLVKSYINELERIEKKKKYKIILLLNTWGEHGILKDLDLDTIYLVRDPFNSLISYSKPIRHERNFLRRGLRTINSKEWIDAYLEGPERFWIKHAENMLEHKKGIIIRYNNFNDDWNKNVKNLPNISTLFKYRENNISEILTQESIEYIRSKTEKLCIKLNLPTY